VNYSITQAYNYHRKSEGICFYWRWLVCLSVFTITKKIVDGFVPYFMGRFLRGKFMFCYDW